MLADHLHVMRAPAAEAPPDLATRWHASKELANLRASVAYCAFAMSHTLKPNNFLPLLPSIRNACERPHQAARPRPPRRRAICAGARTRLRSPAGRTPTSLPPSHPPCSPRAGVRTWLQNSAEFLAGSAAASPPPESEPEPPPPAGEHAPLWRSVQDRPRAVTSLAMAPRRGRRRGPARLRRARAAGAGSKGCCPSPCQRLIPWDPAGLAGQ